MEMLLGPRKGMLPMFGLPNKRSSTVFPNELWDFQYFGKKK
jgi:hypothetical protein